MSQNNSHSSDWLAIAAITAIAVSVTITFHEGIHALICVGMGGDLLSLSALSIECNYASPIHRRIVAGSAAIGNIILGLLILPYSRRTTHNSNEYRFFIWLFMCMNFMNGAGYLMFSGIANVADWAVVIDGWEPHWLWRVILTLVGTVLYTFFVWLSLKEWGKIVGGESPENLQRSLALGLTAYFTVIVVVAAAGAMLPEGLISPAGIFGLIGVAGGLSPLAWMMGWFRADMFKKHPGKALTIHRKWIWLAVAAVALIIYVLILAPTLYF